MRKLLFLRYHPGFCNTSNQNNFGPDYFLCFLHISPHFLPAVSSLQLTAGRNVTGSIVRISFKVYIFNNVCFHYFDLHLAITSSRKLEHKPIYFYSIQCNLHVFFNQVHTNSSSGIPHSDFT